MTKFFGDRSGIGAIDYVFAAALAFAARDCATSYGAVAGPVIRHLLGVAS